MKMKNLLGHVIHLDVILITKLLLNGQLENTSRYFNPLLVQCNKGTNKWWINYLGRPGLN